MDSSEQPDAPVGGAQATNLEGHAPEREAPRSGAPAAGGAPPLLDIKSGNVPRGTVRPRWTPKQCSTRRAVIDRLRFWQASGFQCLWVTLTSAPDSPEGRLREDFHVLRKRIGRERGFPDFPYICVDTQEGHGVLHMIWAWLDPDSRKRASFYIPFEWLQEEWKAIHGAFHVNIKRIGGADRDARKLSNYIVAQYCGGQNALVRLSQSRMPYPFAKMRQALLRGLRSLPERYTDKTIDRKEFADGMEGTTAFGREFNRWFWAVFRNAWDGLVRSRSCSAFGVQFAWWGGELQRV